MIKVDTFEVKYLSTSVAPVEYFYLSKKTFSKSTFSTSDYEDEKKTVNIIYNVQ